MPGAFLLDDFLLRALLGGVGVAMAVGPLGCFVVWRRMAYFGDTLAHSALLGVALGFLLAIDLTVGIVATCVALAVVIVLMQEQRRWSTDTLLGLLSHSALAIGLVIISVMDGVRIDLMGYLFGDILAVGRADLAWIWSGGVVVLAGLAAVWRPLLALTVHDELARAEGIPSLAVRLTFTLLLAVVIAIAMKIVGILLITSLLIIPAAAARRFATTPEGMAVAASIIGSLAVAAGLWGSLNFDTPSGPSVVVAALLIFVAVQAAGALLRPARGA
ncbi:metal ABC transporter permease [Arenibaculum sp.]|jgi:zinc transport system permease protein|uniref:metal ABC transporter permease n=1 Tax=Arenibaculum sp. TaxID=2865862 RepID=UPI002E0F67F9|nr:metal ABC transporter permease [Arenibaculum sp.]